MKKYLFGLSAIVLAIAFSAFTHKTTGQVYFYQGSTSFDATSVETSSNWILDGTVPTGFECGGTEFTCKIILPEGVDGRASMTSNSPLRSSLEVLSDDNTVAKVIDVIDHANGDAQLDESKTLGQESN